jgi:glycine hydroxymethyltransferase
MKALFRCAQADVRAISGTIANDAVFSVLIPRDAPVYANTVATGGHISHQKLGALGRYTRNYRNFPMLPDGYRVDVAKLKDEIAKDPPVAVLFGRSLFIHPEPVREVAEVCREKKILIIYDGAHVLGLIAGRQFQDPLGEGADVLMGSTHKTYFGPQRGVVLSNLPEAPWKKIDRAVFPGMTSNHHLDTLPPLLAATLEFRTFGEAYAKQVVSNARALAGALVAKGFAVDGKDFGYTHSHQVAVNVGAQGGGKKASEVLKVNDIICNMNLLPSEQGRSPLDPGGIRIGVQEMTRVGMQEPEMAALAGLMHEILVLGKNARAEVNALRARFPNVLYSFDNGAAAAP